MTIGVDVSYRHFANVENSDRSVQPLLFNAISIVSTCCNIPLFCIILCRRKGESRLYQFVFLVQNVSLWLAQLHWAAFHSPVFLFPFPAIYGIGLLAPFLNSFVLITIWIFVFAIAVLSIFLILLLRLHGVARNNGVFHFSPRTYYFISVLLTAYIYIPILSCWLPSASSDSEIREFVLTFYPNTAKVLNFPGIFVYTDQLKFQRIPIVSVIMLSTGGLLYIALCQTVIYEIRRNCQTWSEKFMKYQKKALKDTLVETAVMGVFLAMAPCLQIMNAFMEPETDTVTATLVTNAVFVSAPIPFSLTILFQKTHYRRFIVSKFKKPKRTGSRIQILPVEMSAMRLRIGRVP